MSGTIIGFDKAMKALRVLQKQTRFATAGALNDTARSVQQHEINSVLPSALILRSRGTPWWKPGQRFGINARFANKLNLQSSVSSQADWLREVEHGGTKQASGHRLAIPTPATKQPREIMSRQKKPRAILRRRGTFVVAEGAAIPAGIYQRTGPERFPIRMLFGFKRDAQVEARLGFEAKGMAHAQSVYRRFFDARLAKAIMTAKF